MAGAPRCARAPQMCSLVWHEGATDLNRVFDILIDIHETNGVLFFGPKISNI